MKITIEGNASKLNRLAKELRLRAKRDKLKMTLQETVDEAESGDANIEDINVEEAEEVKAVEETVDEADPKGNKPKKKNFLGL